jgi:hypothetical protein
VGAGHVLRCCCIFDQVRSFCCWRCLFSRLNLTFNRSLFLLHQSILALIGSPSTDHAQAHIAQSSRLALDTASKMMVDVARSHRENLVNADLLPIFCTYNLRVARKHIEGRSNYTGREDSADDISALLAQEKVFHERWSCLRHHGS